MIQPVTWTLASGDRLSKPPASKREHTTNMASVNPSLTNCRFYENKYPDIDSFVMVNVYRAPFCLVMNPTDLEPRSNKSATRLLQTSHA